MTSRYAASLGLVVAWLASSALADDAEGQAKAVHARIGQFVGAASCSASGCHGAAKPEASRLSSYRVWLEKDPHAYAWETLHSQASQEIAWKFLPPGQRAWEASECLACHSPQALPKTQSSSGRRLDIADSVGCETCHGPASGWLREHADPTWQASVREGDRASERHAELIRRGLAETQDLLQRTRLCAGCHLGEAKREVNHDLIAAGHPRLAFEMTGYLANMPAHWDIEADRRRTFGLAKSPSDDPAAAKRIAAAFEAKLWLVGQFATAEGAARLLAHRSQDVAGRVWPEFAEHSCSSCHHGLGPSLGAGSTREPRLEGFWRLPSRKRSDPAWGVWHFGLLPGAVAVTYDPLLAKPLADAIQMLQAELGKPLPNRDQVSNVALWLADSLDGLAANANAQKDANLAVSQAQRLLLELVGPGARLAGENWDAGAQLYLALSALRLAAFSETSPVKSQEQHVLDRTEEFYKQLVSAQWMPRDGDPVEKTLREIAEAMKPSAP